IRRPCAGLLEIVSSHLPTSGAVGQGGRGLTRAKFVISFDISKCTRRISCIDIDTATTTMTGTPAADGVAITKDIAAGAIVAGAADAASLNKATSASSSWR